MRVAAVAVFASLCAAEVGLCADPADRRAIVEEMLKRSRLLEDAHFQVPRRLYRQFLRDTRPGREPQAPPAPVPMIAEEALYRLSVPAAGADAKPVLTATLRLAIFDPSRCRNLPAPGERKKFDLMHMPFAE